MYHSWLDQWDERKARRGDAVKDQATFLVDADLGFSGAPKTMSLEGFCDLAEEAASNPAFFDETDRTLPQVAKDGTWIKFLSDVSTDVLENNTVCAKVTDSGSLDHALVIFHHWNASSRNHQIADFFSRRGITVVEIAMPYHFERSRPGSLHADFMLSPNLGRTVQSVRQAVLDGRKLIRWLKHEGYGKISVFGMSLGSWIAGLVTAHEKCVSKTALFLTGGSLADMVWSGRATRQIRASLETKIELQDLKRAWSPLNLENYAQKLARSDLKLQIVLAKRDTVVLPELSENFVRTLRQTGVEPDVLMLNCGHYSLGIPPYILNAGLRLSRFLR